MDKVIAFLVQGGFVSTTEASIYSFHVKAFICGWMITTVTPYVTYKAFVCMLKQLVVLFFFSGNLIHNMNLTAC